MSSAEACDVVARVLAQARPGTLAELARRVDGQPGRFATRRQQAATLRQRMERLADAGYDEEFLSAVVWAYQDEQAKMDDLISVLEAQRGLDAA